MLTQGNGNNHDSNNFQITTNPHHQQRQSKKPIQKRGSHLDNEYDEKELDIPSLYKYSDVRKSQTGTTKPNRINYSTYVEHPLSQFGGGKFGGGIAMGESIKDSSEHSTSDNKNVMTECGPYYNFNNHSTTDSDSPSYSYTPPTNSLYRSTIYGSLSCGQWVHGISLTYATSPRIYYRPEYGSYWRGETFYNIYPYPYWAYGDGLQENGVFHQVEYNHGVFHVCGSELKNITVVLDTKSSSAANNILERYFNSGSGSSSNHGNGKDSDSNNPDPQLLSSSSSSSSTIISLPDSGIGNIVSPVYNNTDLFGIGKNITYKAYNSGYVRISVGECDRFSVYPTTSSSDDEEDYDYIEKRDDDDDADEDEDNEHDSKNDDSDNKTTKEATKYNCEILIILDITNGLVIQGNATARLLNIEGTILTAFELHYDDQHSAIIYTQTITNSYCRIDVGSVVGVAIGSAAGLVILLLLSLWLLKYYMKRKGVGREHHHLGKKVSSPVPSV
ncbi:hypothetical protein H4219_005787 [Mycoemilia scoparia]|uniref:Uncharacterized protein n=1 Tax=Mycoemilia scoparia TaxID=417184 RepID=A0A9W8DPD4_9FUNG|nr:hypothetical protein H4219_005787 [Mycoemilia scoparia]